MRNETGVTLKWYDIGLELLDGNNVPLDEIKENYPNDVNKCCTEMFKNWLQYNPEANWDQLASALSEVGLITAAENIKGEFTHVFAPHIIQSQIRLSRKSPNSHKCAFVFRSVMYWSMD